MTSEPADHDDHAPVLVLGLGNLLLRDDGVGLTLLARLRDEHAALPGVEWLDGGTQGLALLGRLAGRRGLLVLDAVALGDAPGTVHVLPDAAHRPPARGAVRHRRRGRAVGGPHGHGAVGAGPRRGAGGDGGRGPRPPLARRRDRPRRDGGDGMHELSIATELYRACRAEIEGRGGGRLEVVRIAVGELSAVEPDLLRSAWPAVTHGGPDAEATLEIDWHPARQTCPTCGPVAERQAGTWLRLCPACERPLIVEGGRELDIVRIEFEPAVPAEEVCT
ncbi:MAG: hydrogenase maturation protease [Planctomycetota bacterium]|jgi:hydrogenase nickel insertion protein HypA